MVRREIGICSNEIDVGVLANIIMLAGLSVEDAVSISNQEDYKENSILTLKLIINDIEIDLEKGLQRIADILHQKNVYRF